MLDKVCIYGCVLIDMLPTYEWSAVFEVHYPAVTYGVSSRILGFTGIGLEEIIAAESLEVAFC